MLSSEQLNEIRKSVDIVDIVSNYLPLIARGKNHFGVCPFHDDHSPSMCVSKDKQIYTCFVCGATGNAFQFVKEYENISFIEAVRKVAEAGGISVSISEFERVKKQSPLYDVYELSSKLYQLNLSTNHGSKAREYLNKRGINNDIIKEFGIGLALPKGNITDALLKKGFDEQTLLDSALVSKSEYGTHDIYRNRIMFPLWDLNGKVVGFSGRIFNGETDQAKYINSRETEIFKKGELLYNYHRAKNECRRKNNVIVMEGFMDVICAHTHGITNVVAAMGTAITTNTAKLISRMAKNITLCFDGDEAGIMASYACTNELLKLGVFPNVVVLDKNKGKDPDEYIKNNGIDAFLDKLNHPLSSMEFKEFYNKRTLNLSDDVGKAEYVKRMIEEIEKIDDVILREVTINKLSLDTGLDKEFIKSQTKEKNIKPKEIITKKENGFLNKYQKAEMNLLYYMLKNKNHVLQFEASGTFLPTDKYRFLAREICAYTKKCGNISPADFLTFVIENEDIVKTLGEITTLDLKEEASESEIEDYLNCINEYNKKIVIEKLQLKMKNTIDVNEKLELARQIAVLNGRGE